LIGFLELSKYCLEKLNLYLEIIGIRLSYR